MPKPLSPIPIRKRSPTRALRTAATREGNITINFDVASSIRATFLGLGTLVLLIYIIQQGNLIVGGGAV